MATRLYLSSTATSPITPAYSAYWTRTAGAVRRALLTDKDDSALDPGEAGGLSGSSKQFRLQWQGNVALTSAVSFSGTAKLVIAGWEANAADSAGAQCLIRVIDADGVTVLATLYAGDTASTVDTVRELSVASDQTGATVRIMEMTLSPYSATAGAYLDVEIGVQQNYAGSTSSRIGRVITGAPSTTDQADTHNSATPTLAPWIEFSDTLFGPSIPAVAASLTGSGAFSATVTEVHAVAGAMSGSGAFSATVTSDAPSIVTGNLTGSGDFAAVAKGIHSAQAALAGMGVFTATALEVVSGVEGELDLSTFVSLYGSTTYDGTGLVGTPKYFTIPGFVLDPATTYEVTVDYEWMGSFDGQVIMSSISGPTEAEADTSTSSWLGDAGGIASSGSQTITIGPGLQDWNVGVVGAEEFYVLFTVHNLKITGITVTSGDPLAVVTGNFGGSGAFTATAYSLNQVAKLNGSGSFTATRKVVYGVAASLVGSGAFTATSVLVAPPLPVVSPDGIIRWIFQDMENLTSVVLPLNPREMSTPTLQARDMQWAWGGAPGAVMSGAETTPGPMEWTFTGVLLTKSHYDLLLEWTTRLHILRVTDHLGRTFEIIIKKFDPVERRRTATREWRADYTMTCLILERVA